MRRLNDNVWVAGVMWPKGCRPPERVAELIGEHVWEDGDPTVDAPEVETDVPEPVASSSTPPSSVAEPVDVSDVVDEPTPEPTGPEDPAPPVADVPGLPADLPPEPRRAGPGATKAAWVDYAAALHLTTTDDQSRDDIIEMVDAVTAQFPA